MKIFSSLRATFTASNTIGLCYRKTAELQLFNGLSSTASVDNFLNCSRTIQFFMTNPHIIRKLFAGLNAQDVEQCRLVCKAWYQEAIRWLRKCSNSAISQDGVDFTDTQDLNRDQDLYGLVINDRFITGELRNFIVNRLVVPSLGFFRVDLEILGGFWGIVPFNYPTVIVECSSISVPSTHNSVCGQNCARKISYFEALKINRYISDHKIIITDWSDPGSMMADFENREYPVKALIYFVKPWFHSNEMESFISNPDLIVSGAILDSLDSIYFNNSSIEHLETSKCLSISFAGKHVKSAQFSLSVNDVNVTVSDQLIIFKKEINFPIDDGRTFGFLYTKENFDHESINEAWNMVLRSFHGVQFIRIKSWECEDSLSGMFNIHLIRV